MKQISIPLVYRVNELKCVNGRSGSRSTSRLGTGAEGENPLN